MERVKESLIFEKSDQLDPGSFETLTDAKGVICQLTDFCEGDSLNCFESRCQPHSMTVVCVGFGS